MNSQDTPEKPLIPIVETEKEKQQQRSFALFVGYIALLLPITLYLGPLMKWGCARYSLSHFYYSPFYGGLFIGLLAFIGTYLIAYRGNRKDETVAAFIAGICTFGVAFLPTGGHGCLQPENDEFRARAFLKFKVEDGDAFLNLPKNEDGTFILNAAENFTLFEMPLPFGLNFTDLHYISAIGLFSVLLYFCFVVFVRSGSRHENKAKKLTTIKKIRNTIYVLCGSVIYLSMLKLGLAAWHNKDDPVATAAWNLSRGTFRWEAYALLAFGISWMVKGRFVRWLIDDKEKETGLKIDPV